MPRKVVWILLALFVLTRIPMAWLAMNPSQYQHNGINTSSDVDLYAGWATEIVDNGRSAYSDVRIEYPPGALPLILTPQVVGDGIGYLRAFVVMMLLIDIAAFLGLFLMAKRWGSSLGVFIWVLALPALGPIAFLRLDLVPAVATIWAFERASAKDWLGSGGWIGVGAIAKLYPLLFIPAGALLATQRKRFVLAAGAVFLAPLVPLIPSIGDVISSVLGYHADRGIQVESLWGGVLFLAQRAGSEVFLGYSFGALHFGGPLADSFKSVSGYVSIAGLGLATALGFAAGERDRAKTFVEVSFIVLALSLTTGTVFSPQFLLWLLAIGGSVGAMTDSRLRPLLPLLIPAAALSQAVFPFLYNELLIAETLPVTLLWVRNVLVLLMAVGGAALLWFGYRRPVNVPSIPEPASG